MEKKASIFPKENNLAKKPLKKVPPDICKRIFVDVRESLDEIFGENLLFGFVCGGIANGYADYGHDIDIFVCVDGDVSNDKLEKYYNWYFKLHSQYNLPPDKDYPGEIVSKEKLMKTLGLLNDLDLKLKVTRIDIKEAIIWCDMITGGIEAITGSIRELMNIRNSYGHHPDQWKQKVLSQISPEERMLWQDKSHTLIMERYMQYPKGDSVDLSDFEIKSF